MTSGQPRVTARMQTQETVGILQWASVSMLVFILDQWAANSALTVVVRGLPPPMLIRLTPGSQSWQ